MRLAGSNLTISFFFIESSFIRHHHWQWFFFSSWRPECRRRHCSVAMLTGLARWIAGRSANRDSRRPIFFRPLLSKFDFDLINQVWTVKACSAVLCGEPSLPVFIFVQRSLLSRAMRSLWQMIGSHLSLTMILGGASSASSLASSPVCQIER